MIKFETKYIIKLNKKIERKIRKIFNFIFKLYYINCTALLHIKMIIVLKILSGDSNIRECDSQCHFSYNNCLVDLNYWRNLLLVTCFLKRFFYH